MGAEQAGSAHRCGMKEPPEKPAPWPEVQEAGSLAGQKTLANHSPTLANPQEGLWCLLPGPKQSLSGGAQPSTLSWLSRGGHLPTLGSGQRWTVTTLSGNESVSGEDHVGTRA